MVVYFTAPPRPQNGFRTFRDAVDDFKRRHAERRVVQLSAPSTTTDAGHLDDPAAYDAPSDVGSPQWLARNALPPASAPDEQMPFAPPPHMTPEEVEAILRERDSSFAQPFQPEQIPSEYFEPPLWKNALHQGRRIANAFGMGAADELLFEIARPLRSQSASRACPPRLQ